MKTNKQAMQPSSHKRGSLEAVNAEQARRRYIGKKIRLLKRYSLADMAKRYAVNNGFDGQGFVDQSGI